MAKGNIVGNISSLLILSLLAPLALAISLGSNIVKAQELVAVSSESQDEQTYAFYSAEQLDQLLAPIALYPDPLVEQILQASTYPLDIIEAYRWTANPDHAALQGEQLNAALETKDWDDSVKSLVAFLQVLKTLNDNLEWTEQLGKAYIAQYHSVMQSVQRLRQLASASGTLTSTPQQTVTTQDSGIYIQPTDPDVMYVPYYNPQYAYGYWPYADYPPYYFSGYTYTQPFIVFSTGVTVVKFAHFKRHHKNRHFDNHHRNWVNGPTVNDRNRMTTGNQQFTAVSPPPIASAPPPARVFRDGAFVSVDSSDRGLSPERRHWRRDERDDRRRHDLATSDNTIRIMDPTRSRQAITVPAEPRTVMPPPRSLTVEQSGNQNVVVRRGRTHMEERVRDAARVSVPNPSIQQRAVNPSFASQPQAQERQERFHAPMPVVQRPVHVPEPVAQTLPMTRSTPVFQGRRSQPPEVRTNFQAPVAQQRLGRRDNSGGRSERFSDDNRREEHRGRGGRRH